MTGTRQASNARRRVRVGWLALLAGLCAAPSTADASYAVYVGRHLSRTKSVLIGGTGEEVSSHWLELRPRERHAAGATLEMGVTAEARIPGERITIPQVPVTYRYLSMEYSNFEGFPPPLTNGGINEYQVAVRDVWAPCREELVEMTPTPQRGLSYSDLARLVLERARTAREGVELIGALIAEHGYATYGGNTHLIADPEEAWVVWELAGGQGLWAAERLGPDALRVLYPGSIGAFPLDYAESPDHMGAPDLLRFAETQGWYRRGGGRPFDLWEVYGAQGKHARRGDFKLVGPAQLERELRAKAPLSERDMMDWVREPRISDDEAGYGFVAALRPGYKAPVVRAWIAPTSAVAAPFLPWWIGVRRIPPELGRHRYLTRGAASHFLHPDQQLQEATPFAGRLFKRVLYYACRGDANAIDEVHALLRAFEEQSARQLDWLEPLARSAFGSGQRPRGHDLLTFYAHARAREAMALGERLADMLHTRLELAGELRTPGAGPLHQQAGAPTVHCLSGGVDPDRPARDQKRTDAPTAGSSAAPTPGR